MKSKIYVIFVLSVFMLVSICQPIMIAYAQATTRMWLPGESGEGYSVYLNPDGTRTLEVEVTDEQIEAMGSEDDYDRLQDAGNKIVNVNDGVDIAIEKEVSDDSQFVKISKDDTYIAFTPVIPEPGIEQTVVDEPSADDLSPEPTGLPSSESTEEPSPVASESNESEQLADSNEAGSGEAAEASDTVLTQEQDSTEQVNSTVSTQSQETAAESLPEDVTETITGQEDAPTPSPEPAATPAPAATASAGPSPSPATEESVSPEPVPEEQHVPEAKLRGGSGGSYASVEFEGVFDESTDISLHAKNNGIKEDIVINEYLGNNVFEFIFNFKGLTAEQDGKEIKLYDSPGTLKAVIEAPFMEDANGAYSEDIAVSFEYQNNGTYKLTYTVSESWLADSGRAYPVVIDPSASYTSTDSYGIEDNYVMNTSPGTTPTYNLDTLRVGNDTVAINTAYIKPKIPDSVLAYANNILVKDAKLNIYCKTATGDNSYSIQQVTGGDWNSRDICQNNAPASGSTVDAKTVSGGSWAQFDWTPIASSWFNALDQKQPYGFTMTNTSGAYGSYATFVSADTPSHRMTYSITYEYNLGDPAVRITPHGNAANSGTGYFDLSWNAVSGADGYLVGVYNGIDYEYFNVGNVTSWSTKNKGIWPTSTSEYQLKNGTGGELVTIPAFNYANAPSTPSASDVNYYFRVIPCNRFGHASNPAQFTRAHNTLPDRVQPNTPTSVNVSSATYTNAATINVSWNGVRDYNSDSASISSNLGTGRIQYSIDTPAVEGSWKNTTSNAASSNFNFPTTGLSVGQHNVYIRGKDAAGNTGGFLGKVFYFDNVKPTRPTVTVTPADWSPEHTVSLSWSGISDHTNLSKVEYRFNNTGSWINTNQTGKSYSGLPVPTSSLGSGIHTIYVRAYDLAGNISDAGTAMFKKDIDNPGVTSITLDPDTWSNLDELKIIWENARDDHSGLSKIEYAINENLLADVTTFGQDGEETVDISTLDDGEHKVTVKMTDGVGNNSTYIKNFYRDVTDPEIDILTPQTDDLVNGVIEIWGNVHDLSLDKWMLTALGEKGKLVEIATGTDEMGFALLGTLNTSVFDDMETIELTLHAIDKAGNESTVTGVVIKVDKSAKPVASSVKITSPAASEKITVPTTLVEYEKQYTEDQQTALYYVDSVLLEERTDESAFDFDTITYLEGSAHSLSILSIDENGLVHYSNGLNALMLFSDAFEDDSFTQSTNNVSYTSDGAFLTNPAQDGEVISVVGTSPKNIMALRLTTTEVLPAGTSIEYFYSIDNGATWEPIYPEDDVVIRKVAKKVQLKAIMHGANGGSPNLKGWQLEDIVEGSPSRVFVNLTRNAETFKLTHGSTITDAEAKITSDLPLVAGKTENSWLYVDGELHAEEHVYDALTAEEDTDRSFVAAAASTDGDSYVSHKTMTSLLLRENLPAGSTGEVVSGKITSGRDVYVIRLDALLTVADSAEFFFSLDGKEWYPISLNYHTALPEMTRELYIKADISAGSELVSWHLEGTGATARCSTIDLITYAPINVVAADYGEYYENTSQKHYVITWEDKNVYKPSDPCAVGYNIYKDGVLIATIPNVGALKCIDTNYVPGAQYAVSVVKQYTKPDNEYEHFLTRESPLANATTVVIPKEKVLVAVTNDLYEYKQSEFLNNLYGGDYTFSKEPTAPTGERLIDLTLLGKNKYCAIGYEPINFNTGNFFMMQTDYAYEDLGGANLNIVRTYNTKAEAENGPFGAKWENDFTQHLMFYGDGSLAYIKPDGSYVFFYPQEDGSYTGDNEDYIKLHFDEMRTEFVVSYPDNSKVVFTSAGLLKSLVTATDTTTQIERSEEGFITGVVGPSGARLDVVMDDAGHITEITVPGGGTVKYEYEGNNLVSFTDQEGNSKKYVYDSLGRMTEWFDENSTRQVYNEYDEDGRVVFQIDAQEGEYHLEYFDDHTVTTDADGYTNEIYFDSLKRTIREVDANGNEKLYAYDENGNQNGIVEKDGTLTSYEYDEDGNKVKEYDELGNPIEFEYDENNNITGFTDQNGNVTEYEYDSLHNLTKQVNPDGGVHQYQYNQYGQLVLEIDALENHTSYEYDGRNLVRTVMPNGGVYQYSYDAAGNMIQEVDPTGMATRYTYDLMSRVKEVIFADNSRSTFEYDGVGNQVAATDPNGETTQYEYDGMSRLTKTILPSGQVSATEYTMSGNVKVMRDAVGQTLGYEYDGNGNVLSQTDSVGNTSTFEYDTQDRLVAETNPAGATIQYEYDPVSGLLSKAIDSNGNETSYAYDDNGNLTEETNPYGSQTLTEYDSLNRPVKITYPNGSSIITEYDEDSRVIAQTDQTGGVTLFEYDANGNVTKTTNAAGQTTVNEYDEAGKLVSVQVENGSVYRYEYNDVGLLSKTIDPLGNVEEYEYDDAANLVQATNVRGSVTSYAYDENSLPTVTTLSNGGTVKTEYDDAGRVLSETDALGNITAYEYSKNGKVSKVIDAIGGEVTYRYDVLGNVIEIRGPNGYA